LHDRIRDPRNPALMESRMQILITLGLTAVAVLQTSSFGAALQQSQPLLVKSVVNGDTIDVATVGRVRLLGIDAPAAGRGAATPAPFGREALDRLTSLVLNRWVRLEREGKPGVSTRHQAYVITGDGLFVNAALVREGLARVSVRTAVTRLAELQRAEAEARAARRGIWGSAPPVPLAGYTPEARAIRTPAPRNQKDKTRKKQP
jgi:endonuclease YncB( thermonuclease family)